MNGPLTASVSATDARIEWVDSAKGFGIILVVLGHVLRGIVASNLIPLTSAVRFVDAWIYAFHMPLFFFVAGLFLFRSVAKPVGEFARNKIRTLAYPYLLWSLITLLIKSPLGQSVNQPRDLSQIPKIFYDPIEQFWFLYVLFLLSIAFGLLLKFGMKARALIVLAALMYPGILPLQWSGWEPLELARYYGIYLALGVMVGSKQGFQFLADAGAKTLAAIAAFGFSIITSLAIFLETQHPHSLDFILAVSGVAAVVSLSVLANREKIDSAIRFLGRYSLEIFVAHTIASAAIRILLQQFCDVTTPALYVLVGTIAGLYGPVLLAIALKHIGFRWAFVLSTGDKASNFQSRPRPQGPRRVDNRAETRPSRPIDGG